MRFSERLGYVTPRLTLKEDEVPETLKNRLWNITFTVLLSPIRADDWSSNYDNSFFDIAEIIRSDIFGMTIDDICEHPSNELEVIKENFMALKFPQIFDFLEDVANIAQKVEEKRLEKSPQRFRFECNKIFEDAQCQFRFVDRSLAKIVEAHEINEVESASQSDAPFSTHISAALVLYSKRPEPDFRNAVKEAISAVEAAAKSYCGDRSADLEKALAKLDAQIGLHKQVLAAFKNLYRWTSAADGIRHAMMEETNLSEHETRFMIIACSAFCNLLVAAQSRQ